MSCLAIETQKEVAVQSLQHLARAQIGVLAEEAVQLAVNAIDRQCGGDSVAGDIQHDHVQPARLVAPDIDEVAAELLHRLVAVPQLERPLRDLTGKQHLVDRAGLLQFLLKLSVTAEHVFERESAAKPAVPEPAVQQAWDSRGRQDEHLEDPVYDRALDEEEVGKQRQSAQGRQHAGRLAHSPGDEEGPDEVNQEHTPEERGLTGDLLGRQVAHEGSQRKDGKQRTDQKGQDPGRHDQPEAVPNHRNAVELSVLGTPVAKEEHEHGHDARQQVVARVIGQIVEKGAFLPEGSDEPDGQFDVRRRH